MPLGRDVSEDGGHCSTRVLSPAVCAQQALKDISEALSSEEFVPREAAGLIIGLKRSGAPTILSWTKAH